MLLHILLPRRRHESVSKDTSTAVRALRYSLLTIKGACGMPLAVICGWGALFVEPEACVGVVMMAVALAVASLLVSVGCRRTSKGEGAFAGCARLRFSGGGAKAVCDPTRRLKVSLATNGIRAGRPARIAS